MMEHIYRNETPDEIESYNLVERLEAKYNARPSRLVYCEGEGWAIYPNDEAIGTDNHSPIDFRDAMDILIMFYAKQCQAARVAIITPESSDVIEVTTLEISSLQALDGYC